MKKLLALILAVMMIATLSVSAFAAENPTDKTDDLYYDKDTDQSNSDTNSVDKKGDVVVTIGGAEDIAKVYYVQVVWQNLEFNYTFKEGVKWNPEDHKYGVVVNGSWVYDAEAVGEWDKLSIPNAIEVKNHSNDSVNVHANYNVNAAMAAAGVTATLANDMTDKVELVTAEGKAFADADNVTYTLSITDTTPNADTEFTVGTITVTVSHP